MRILAMVVLGLFISVGNSFSQDADLQKIDDLVLAWEEETNAGDVKGLLPLLTDDAVILAPGMSAMSGKAAIEAAYRDYYSTYDLQYVATPKEVEVYDNRAYVWARVEGTRRTKEDDRQDKLAFDNVWLLKRHPDGWKIWRVAFNTSPVSE